MNKKKTYTIALAILVSFIAAAGTGCTGNFISISEKQSAGRASAHILLYSDIGYANEGEYEVTEAIAARHTEYPFSFAISAGDNIQLKPGISGPRSMIWGNDVMKETFELPFDTLIRDGMRFYAAMGNHDHQGLRKKIELKYSKKTDAQKRGAGGFVLPAPDYVIRRNGIKIVFLDVATAFSSLNWSEQRASFVRRALQTQQEKWQILVFHYPLWSSGEHGRDKALSDLREVMLPVLKDCPVDFVITGHDHHAELFYYQGRVKTRIAIAGNTAKPHDLPYEPEIPCVFRTNSRGFAEIDIQDNRAVLTFRSTDGTVMFSDNVQK
ncbi:MAG: metallophosphoesterase [Spirochaetes bacterium]|nr:metallophosphoesterase [Spirochaetota bacterium]